MFLIKIRRDTIEPEFMEIVSDKSSIRKLIMLLERSTDDSVSAFTVSDIDGIVEPESLGFGKHWKKWIFKAI